MTDRKIIAMTNEEFEAVLAEAKKQLALGVELPELLRRMGDAVSASPQPRCPKCRTERIARYMLIFGRLSCPECKAEFHVQCPDDFAQFFAAAPAQEPDEAEIVRLSLEDWRYGCFVGEWSEVEAQRLLKEGQAIAEKLHDAVSKLAKLRGLKFMTFSAQEQPVENSPQDDFENKFIGNWKDAKPLKCCEVCGETEMLTVMGRNKYACPKHRAVSTAEPTER